ncbi:MAG TPA: UvrD-helicase domain-containing protein [Candidatus Binatia bacterium]|nr:UvrD-helicase domain-containing protein [Candidatus Binatia bacterium]
MAGGELNPEQQKAVEHRDGPLLVLAGAGSGKTRVLTHRIAHLIRAGHARPEELLAVTFTNKAAREMRERIERLIGTSAGALWVGTFHSISSRLLRRHIEMLGLGYQSSFIVYDDQDQLGVLTAAVEGRSFPVTAQALLARIDQAKNEALTPERLLAAAATPTDVAAAQAYALYQAALVRNNAVDFGDLLLLALKLFERVPEVARRYQQGFRHLLVDEYQDTNRAQYLWLHALAGVRRNLSAVGDEDQSIYGWRGADIRNILEFEKHYPDATVIRLEQNYRSTQSILAAAGAVIRNNQRRRGTTLRTENPRGSRTILHHADDERAEARFVVQEIARESQKRPLGDFVVFYRTNAQSRVFEEECLRGGIPYSLVGGFKFYERKEIKDMLAYLRIIANPDDEWSLSRIVNVPARGVGTSTRQKLVAAARARDVSLEETLADPPEALPTAVREKVLALAKMLAELRTRASGPIGALVEEIFRATGYLEGLRAADHGAADSRVEDLREFVTLAQEADRQGQGLIEFLEQAALVADADALSDDRDRITLMTLHTSKGLEFPVVFLVGMEEGLFPHRRSLTEPDTVEEERRLCYVGMTRAREQLYLSCARRRHLFGVETKCVPSRFLREIPAELLEVCEIRSNHRDTDEPRERVIDYGESQLAVPPRSIATRVRPSFPVGTRVRHPTLGEGVVRATEGNGAREKVTVMFSGFGTRKLAVAVARLEAV